MQDLNSSHSEPEYAGFGLRLAAWLIDSVMVRIPCFVLALVLALSTALVTDKTSVAFINLGLVFVVLVVPALYAGVFESPRLQATPGKLLMKIRVTDMNGQRCRFARAFMRNLTFVLSDLTIGIGYLMVCWTKRQQCLHDKIARCLVLKVKANL